MNFDEAIAETKHFIEVEAKLVGVEPEDLIKALKNEFEIDQFVEAVKNDT